MTLPDLTAGIYAALLPSTLLFYGDSTYAQLQGVSGHRCELVPATDQERGHEARRSYITTELRIPVR